MTAPVLVDYYGQCVDALIAYHLKQPDLAKLFVEPWQVGRNDSKLNEGADYFLFFRPGRFPVIGPAGSNPLTSLVKDYAWQIHADLYASYKDYETSWANWEKARAAIVWAIGTNPGLQYDKTTHIPGGMGVGVEGINEPLPFRSTKGLGAFIIGTLLYTVVQRVKFELVITRS